MKRGAERQRWRVRVDAIERAGRKPRGALSRPLTYSEARTELRRLEAVGITGRLEQHAVAAPAAVAAESVAALAAAADDRQLGLFAGADVGADASASSDSPVRSRRRRAPNLPQGQARRRRDRDVPELPLLPDERTRR